MKPTLAQMRMQNQRLGFQQLETPLEVVRHLGAIQAQDYEMAIWAIGLRMQVPNYAQIEQAFNLGLIVRTHILRPTWHIIPAEDLKWMMDFSAPYITKLSAYQNKLAGLDEYIFKKTRNLIEKAFYVQDHYTRDELVEYLKKNKINMDGLRAIHILYDAECQSLICSGPKYDKQHSYALINQRIPVSIHKTKEEALFTLTQRYMQSHGPATASDLAKWMSIPLMVAKAGIDMIRNQLTTYTYLGSEYHSIPSTETYSHKNNSLWMLPAFDEYLISYADRNFALDEKFRITTMSINGILNPTLVYKGKVIGLWKRKKIGKNTVLGLNWFYPVTPTLLQKLKKSITHYEKFIGKPVVVEV